MKSTLLPVIFFCSTTSFTQQSIGFELSTRLEDLSGGISIQHEDENGFLGGGGILIQGRYAGYCDDYTQPNNPFEFVETTFTENGNYYSLNGYNVRSSITFAVQGMMGYIHHFSDVHGIRFNVGYRFGIANSSVVARYVSFTDTEFNTKQFQGWHTYSAISTELYHVMNTSEKWDFFYGIKYPLFFGSFDYNPAYSTDIYWKSKIEFTVGLLRNLKERQSKAKKEKEPDCPF